MQMNLEERPKKVLAIDLATNSGWSSVEVECVEHPDKVLVEDCGRISFGSDPIKRWLVLEKEIKNLFNKFNPSAIIIETNFVYRNIATTALLNQLRGAILLMAALNSISVYEVDNQVAKKHMFGTTKYWSVKESKYVGVSKEMMYNQVCGNICHHSIKPQDFDASDSIALAMTFYDSKIEHIPLTVRE